MTQFKLGQIYAIEREDLMRVYVGQSVRLKRRMYEHRKANTRGLFTDGEPDIKTLGTAASGDALDNLEMTWARRYYEDGWIVTSKNVDFICWRQKDHEHRSHDVRSEEAKKWHAEYPDEKKADLARRISEGKLRRPPEERRQIALDWNASRTPEERSASAYKREAALTPEERSDRSRRARASLSPEDRLHLAHNARAALTREQELAAADAMHAAMTPEKLSAAGAKGGSKTASMRRRCTTCGLTTTPPSMAVHLKASRHSGYEQVSPDG